jgi:hypothetical protein
MRITNVKNPARPGIQTRPTSSIRQMSTSEGFAVHSPPLMTWTPAGYGRCSIAALAQAWNCGGFGSREASSPAAVLSVAASHAA